MVPPTWGSESVLLSAASSVTHDSGHPEYVPKTTWSGELT